MANNDDVNRLRKEVAKARQRATAKIGRIRRNTGMNVGNTEYDVRRDPKAQNRYNARQLKAYLNQLNTFVSRETSFVALAGNEPVSRKEWNKFKALEAKSNKTRKEFFNRVSGAKLESGVTIAQHHEALYGTSDRLHADGNMTVSPLGVENRSPANINGRAALSRIAKRLEKTASPAHHRNNVKAWRKGFNDMLIEIGAHDLMEQTNELSDKQFYAAWNGGMADLAKTYYYAAKKYNEGNKAANFESIATAHSSEIKRFLTWAGTLKFKGKNA